MDKILRVNMGNLEVSEEKIGGDYSGLGGRGLTSVIVSKEVPATCNAVGLHNKLVIAPGLLTGTAAANSGRLSVGAKSPLTGDQREQCGRDRFNKISPIGHRCPHYRGNAGEGKTLRPGRQQGWGKNLSCG